MIVSKSHIYANNIDTSSYAYYIEKTPDYIYYLTKRGTNILNISYAAILSYSIEYLAK